MAANKYLRLARAVTLLTTPPIVGGLFIFYLLLRLSPSAEIFYKTFASVFFLSILLPVIFIFFLVRKEHIGNFHMKGREERTLPFGFILISGTLSLLVVKYLEADSILFKIFLIYFLMGLGYSIITFLKFKLSGHMFVFTSTMMVLAFFIDFRFIYLAPFLLLIGWSRVYLKEHTIGEVAGGASYAIVSFIIFSLLLNS